MADWATTVHLLYSDHEGGQRAISRFQLVRPDASPDEPGEPSQWVCSVVRHWNLDRDDPR
jgi:hypothetical protein